MIILPNRFERYLKSLRLYTSFSISKHGFKDKHLKNLRKICLCEAFLYKHELNVTSLKLLSFNLLTCISSAKSNFNFRLKLPQNVLINKKLYIILLVLLSNNSDFLKLDFQNGILIKGNGDIKNSLSVIKNLKSLCFFEIKTQKYLIFLPCEKTDKMPDFTESQWHFIYDKFSLLNIFTDNAL